MNRYVGQASTLRSTATPALRSPSSAVALLRRADSPATEDGEDGSCLPPSATPTEWKRSR